MLIVSLGLLGTFHLRLELRQRSNRKAIWMANATYNIGKERNYAYWWALEEIDKAYKTNTLTDSDQLRTAIHGFRDRAVSIELP